MKRNYAIETGRIVKPKARRKFHRGVCRKCGCTETTPCLTIFGPCAWANRSQTLCTACEPENRPNAA